jgi:CheY-like chemotaxis protein
VVDDEASIRLLCRVNLEHDGFRVVEAEDGCQAVEFVSSTPPDLILLDVMMPCLGGFAVASSLLGNPATRTIPLIFLSAKAEAEAQREGIARGALDDLTKPFNPITLLSTIERLLDLADRGDTSHRAARLEELRSRLEQPLFPRKGPDGAV